MAKRAKKKRGPKPKYLGITCPNPEWKQYGKKGLGNVVSHGTYRTRSTGKARLFLCRTCGKAFPVVPGRPSSTFEARGRKYLWARGYWPRAWDFEAPPKCWRSNSIPSGGGWPRQRCIVSRSATCWFGISNFLRFKWMSFGPSLKKTPKSHWTDHPKSPLLAKKGQGRSLGSTWIWRAFARSSPQRVTLSIFEFLKTEV